VGWIGEMGVSVSLKRDEEGNDSSIKSSLFFSAFLFCFTEFMPLSFYNKNPFPFFIYGKGKFFSKDPTHSIEWPFFV